MAAIKTHEVCSFVVTGATGSVPYGGPADIAFIVDNTGSMGSTFVAALKEEIASVLNCIEDSSGSDFRFALLTPDEVQVNVRLAFSANNRAAFEQALDLLPNANGYDFPESTDECLNTAVNSLTAAGRINPDPSARSTPLQIGDFSPGFRQNVRKLVVLITDAPPGGFQDETHVNHAHQYALEAAAQCIKINAIQVQPEDATTTTVMTDYYQTTCGWYSLIPKSDGNAVGAILKMLYEPGYCNCP